MSIFSNEQHSLMRGKLTQAIKDFSYRFKRYDVNYSMAMGHSPENIDMSPLSQHIRETDRFIVLNHNTCVVIFDCANDEAGTKAANNMLTRFEGTFFSTPLFTSIVTASNYENVSLMMDELFYLLNYAIQHNMKNILMGHSQVIQKQ